MLVDDTDDKVTTPVEEDETVADIVANDEVEELVRVATVTKLIVLVSEDELPGVEDVVALELTEADEETDELELIGVAEKPVLLDDEVDGEPV